METRVDSVHQWIAYTTGWFTAWFEDGKWRTGLRDNFDSNAVLDDPVCWMALPEGR